MTARLRELAARRDSLIIEAQQQRDLLARTAEGIYGRLRVGDRLWQWARAVQRKPLAIALATAAAAMLIARPARAVKWLGYVYSAVSFVRTLTRLLSRGS